MLILGDDVCTNHACDKSCKCKWYISNNDAYKAKKVFVNNEMNCKIYGEKECEGSECKFCERRTNCWRYGNVTPSRNKK